MRLRRWRGRPLRGRVRRNRPGQADFLATLFGDAAVAAPAATAAPISVLPPAVNATGGGRRGARAPRRHAVPPLPRLRPPYAPAARVAEASRLTPSVAPAGVDRTVTGSIEDAAPAGTAPSEVARLPAEFVEAGR